MINPKEDEQHQLLPLIDEIVQRKLLDLASAHSAGFTDLQNPLSPAEWELLLQSDLDQEGRKAAVTRIYAAIPRRGNYPIGDPRDIESVLNIETEIPMADLLAYFIEATIENITSLYESLKKSEEFLAYERSKSPVDKEWEQDALSRVEENLRLLRISFNVLSKYRWLAEHAQDPMIEKELTAAFEEIKKTSRGALK